MLNKSLLNVPIMSLQNGSKLGVTQEAIIDPRKLQIIAYYAAGPRIHQSSVVFTGDIREVGPLGYIVDSADQIMEIDEGMVRLSEVIGFHFSLIGKQVVDEAKHKLGKVAEYATETDGFYIQKLHISQSVMKNITSTNLIVHRSQIVEITDSAIVVRSGSVKESVGLVQAVVNPFRKNRPTLAPDSAESLVQPQN